MHMRVPTLVAVVAALAVLAVSAASCITDQTMIWTLDGGSSDASGADSGPDASSAVCGNGNVEPGEECDDGNTASGDGCASNCTSEVDPEICDNGSDDDGDGLVDCADSDCANNPACPPACGNGILEAGEECDDGNFTLGDGCDGRCLLEENAYDCGDGIDNDSDGLTDCADADCAGYDSCP
ncbi:MAG: DUF4215 domain-containing protein [bacterium]